MDKKAVEAAELITVLENELFDTLGRPNGFSSVAQTVPGVGSVPLVKYAATTALVQVEFSAHEEC